MASGHAAVPEGKDCMVCYDELSAETYAEYRVSKLDEGCTQEAGAPQGAWLPSNACSNCIEVGGGRSQEAKRKKKKEKMERRRRKRRKKERKTEERKKDRRKDGKQCLLLLVLFYYF
jgi:hypothetical protein